MPFGRALAPSMLHRHDGHAEAVARIGWCIDQHAIGVITGEVGAGKTVAVRAATATLVPQAAAALAGEHAERGRTPIVVFDFTDRGSVCP